MTPYCFFLCCQFDIRHLSTGKCRFALLFLYQKIQTETIDGSVTVSSVQTKTSEKVQFVMICDKCDRRDRSVTDLIFQTDHLSQDYRYQTYDSLILCEIYKSTEEVTANRSLCHYNCRNDPLFHGHGF